MSYLHMKVKQKNGSKKPGKRGGVPSAVVHGQGAHVGPAVVERRGLPERGVGLVVVDDGDVARLADAIQPPVEETRPVCSSLDMNE